jgi:hypothetical protein
MPARTPRPITTYCRRCSVFRHRPQRQLCPSSPIAGSRSSDATTMVGHYIYDGAPQTSTSLPDTARSLRPRRGFDLHLGADECVGQQWWTAPSDPPPTSPFTRVLSPPPSRPAPLLTGGAGVSVASRRFSHSLYLSTLLLSLLPVFSRWWWWSSYLGGSGEGAHLMRSRGPPPPRPRRPPWRRHAVGWRWSWPSSGERWWWPRPVVGPACGFVSLFFCKKFVESPEHSRQTFVVSIR